jgi:hypothetical protein
MASLGTVGSVCRCGKHHWHNYRYRHRRQKAVGLRSILVRGGPHMRRREFITLLAVPRQDNERGPYAPV